ncbi:MAG: hypothetical protein GY830_03810 [Bacteroidetes bacterium]|nr:hypothetical protein [Bacteroidota bacterium]
MINNKNYFKVNFKYFFLFIFYILIFSNCQKNSIKPMHKVINQDNGISFEISKIENIHNFNRINNVKYEQLTKDIIEKKNSILNSSYLKEINYLILSFLPIFYKPKLNISCNVGYGNDFEEITNMEYIKKLNIWILLKIKSYKYKPWDPSFSPTLSPTANPTNSPTIDPLVENLILPKELKPFAEYLTDFPMYFDAYFKNCKYTFKKIFLNNSKGRIFTLEKKDDEKKIVRVPLILEANNENIIQHIGSNFLVNNKKLVTDIYDFGENLLVCFYNKYRHKDINEKSKLYIVNNIKLNSKKILNGDENKEQEILSNEILNTSILNNSVDDHIEENIENLEISDVPFIKKYYIQISLIIIILAIIHKLLVSF